MLADTRDNLVNPSAGYYLSWSLRSYLQELGADEDWQELWIEMRVYPHVPKRSENVLNCAPLARSPSAATSELSSPPDR